MVGYKQVGVSPERSYAVDHDSKLITFMFSALMTSFPVQFKVGRIWACEESTERSRAIDHDSIWYMAMISGLMTSFPV